MERRTRQSCSTYERGTIMVKVVDMREALQQVREKAPNTADAMKRFKSGNAGFI